MTDFLETKVNKYDGTLREFTVKDGKREFIAMITTNQVDRDGDVIDPKGMDLKNFNKNPIIFLNHESWNLPIGKAKWLRMHTENGKSGIMAMGYISETSDRANEAWGLMQEKILTTVSIGFGINEGGARPPTEGEIKKFPGIKRMITKSELFEYSVVGVPSNTDAVIQQVSKARNLPDWLGIEDKTVTIKDIDTTPVVEVEDFVKTYELIDLQHIVPITDLIPVEQIEAKAAKEAVEIYEVTALGRVT